MFNKDDFQNIDYIQFDDNFNIELDYSIVHNITQLHINLTI